MEWIEIAAESLDNAKELALDELGVDESDADIEVISEGKTGMFGRVKEEARIRARIRPTPVRPRIERGRGRKRNNSRSYDRASNGSGDRNGSRDRGSNRRDAGAERESHNGSRNGSRNAPRGRSRNGSHDNSRGDNSSRGNSRRDDSRRRERAVSNEESERPDMSLEDQASLAESFVAGLAEIVDVSLVFTRNEVRTDRDTRIIRIEAHSQTGDDELGVLVGPRGLTANAIDELARTVLQRSGGTIHEGRIRMDIGGFRERRESALVKFTNEMAAQVLETGEEVSFEPMMLSDRRVIHYTAADIDGVVTRSEDTEPHRYVVIAPT